MARNPRSAPKIAKSTNEGRLAAVGEVQPSALPADSKEFAELKLGRLSSDRKVAGLLLRSGVNSVRKLAAVPQRELLKRLNGKLAQPEMQALAKAKLSAWRFATKAGDKAITTALSTGPNRAWMLATGEKPVVVPADLCNCGCCGSIFSLKAYLFDLLDLLAHYWDVDLGDVEALLQRKFSAYGLLDPQTFTVISKDLDCDALNAPLPQARIAVEVLEAYLVASSIPLPSSDANWVQRFTDGLLRLITPRELQLAALAGRPNGAKLTTALLDAVPNHPPAFASALTAWKAELGALSLSLAGIDKALSLLSDYAQNFTGYLANALRRADQPDTTLDEFRMRETTRRFEHARDTTLRQWLIDYRQTLVAATGRDVEVLEASLFISLSSGPCRTTTRLQELVTSVQQIVENIRSGEIAALRRSDLPSAFTAELRSASILTLSEINWTRMRDYETWLGHVYGWVYPENVLGIGTILNSSVLQSGHEYFSEISQKAVLGDLEANVAYRDLTICKSGQARVDEWVGRGNSTLRWERESFLEWIIRIDSYHGVISDLFPDEPHGSVFQRHLLFPIIAGHVLHQAGEFEKAHAWFRLLFDPVTRVPTVRFNEGLAAASFEPGPDESKVGDAWLDHPYDPVAIANRRPGVWLRHTVLGMARNLVDWADDDFARGLPDTYQRAEERYELARRLLAANAMGDACETLIMDIRNHIGDFVGASTASAYMKALAEIQSPATLRHIAAKVKRVSTTSLQHPAARKHAALKRIMASAAALERKKHPPKPLDSEWWAARTSGLDFEDSIVLQPLIAGVVQPGVRPRLGPPPELASRLRARVFDGLFDLPEPSPLPAVVSLAFCVPLNPVLLQLRKHVTNQLLKLKRCLDFLGEPQTPRVYGCDTYDPATGSINRPMAIIDQFSYTADQPRYRYNFLVEKARQYIDVAQRIGALLLQALQSRDNEEFHLLTAKHAIELAGATVELRRLGQIEAARGIEIAGLQSERADSQVTFWEKRAGNDVDSYRDTLSDDEKESLEAMEQSIELQQHAATVLRIGSVAAAVGGAVAGAGAIASATGVGAVAGLPMLAIGASVVAAVAPMAAASHQAEAAALSQQSSLASARSSFERRFEDWKNQFELATIDAALADVQGDLAADRAAIADQEAAIAQLQLSHAREELRFHQTKTTNLALYDWMTRVLLRDYRTLMQIAAATARMAQTAVVFERQEPVSIIVGDYWHVANGPLQSPGLSTNQRSFGLLGAERLLTDLTKLDAFKLATDQRRQQLSKTISLARMIPTELVGFRQSGTLTFNTLLTWFDDDVLGHYLRLIKSVKVTVLAIVPPVDGIHATLHNSGESSVVVKENGGRTFIKKRAARNFGDRVSLDAAFNESGLFVFNYDDPMLLPFEGLGVETQWTLEMPRGRNRFYFDTIADVLLTIDYTAEYSPVYEAHQRAEQAGLQTYEETVVPLRLQFPDVWYHFKNHRPDEAGAYTPFSFKFRLPRGAFAPSVTDPLVVVHLTLLVSGNLTRAEQDQVADGLTITHLPSAAAAPQVLHSGKPPRAAVPGDPTSAPVPGDPSNAFGDPLFGGTSLMLSTRGLSARGLAPPPSIGTANPDEWTIEFSRALFPAVVEKISDVLLVITVSGTRA